MTPKITATKAVSTPVRPRVFGHGWRMATRYAKSAATAARHGIAGNHVSSTRCGGQTYVNSGGGNGLLTGGGTLTEFVAGSASILEFYGTRRPNSADLI